MREWDVLLYGATGYTGRLIAHALAESGARFALAGRSADALTRLAAELPTTPPVIAFTPADRAAARDAAARAKVLLSAAGPFVDLGPPLVEAALDAGTHFGHIAGEQAFLQYTWSKDAAAKARQLAILDSLGFDVVPSDLAASVAASNLGAPVESMEIAIDMRGGMSAGTRRTMARSAGLGGYWKHGAFRSAPPGWFARDFAFPAGSRRGVFVPWGDVATAPRSTGARNVRTYFVLKPSTIRWLRAASVFVPLAAPFMRRRGVARAPPPGQGPNEEQRAGARFEIVAEAQASDGTISRSFVTGRNPYGLTGVFAAKAALAVAREGPNRAGALTPTQAFDRKWILDALSPFDLRVTAPS
ncbi:MAG: saccharopine dehydrogenase family protein [Thermoplasmatota archaeon]